LKCMAREDECVVSCKRARSGLDECPPRATSEGDLQPTERIALTVATAQLRRGENPDMNVTAMLALALTRLTGPGNEGDDE
jgi:hypothetical protein